MAVVCLIEGLDERSASGGWRCRHWVNLSPGAELTVMLDAAGAVLVTHGGVDLGHLSSSVAGLTAELQAGRRPRCIVTAIEIGGLFRRRARRVEIQIEETQLSAAAWRMMQGAAGTLAEGSLSAARLAADGAWYAGGMIVDAGSKVGDGVVTYGLKKPAAAVGQGLSAAADATIGRPVRAVRRIIRNVFLAAVAILVLILAIVVVWRLPVLPTFNYGAPPAATNR